MSDDPLFSEHWHRVKDTKPRLATDVVVQRQVYRGVLWYALHRSSTGAYHRVDRFAFELISHLDGLVSVGELWERAVESQGPQAPTQPEMIGLLAELNEAELLTVDRKLNAEQLFARAARQSRGDRRQRYLNPLYLRFSLFDPDVLLNAIFSRTGWLFTRPAMFAWLALVAIALMTVAPKWLELVREIVAFDFLSPAHAVTFFVAYPLLKLIHELAHGLVVKRYGGEVHELGVAFMVLLPIPYVDASSAAVFHDKRQRMLVGAAGIFVELGLAAVAALVWSASSPGPVHDVALLVMLVGGLSTVLFNGNPLLKFDGYYVLADALEIPNLADRSRAYLLGLGRRYLFGSSERSPVPGDPWERVWLIAYGLLASTYRIVLMLTIAFMLSDDFFFFGVALAAWVVVMLVGKPLWQFLRFLVAGSGGSRIRDALVTGALCSVVGAGMFWFQAPLSTVLQGVVWLPDNAIVRVANPCEVTQTYATEGQQITPGEPLFRCEDPALETSARDLQAKVDELQAERSGIAGSDRVKLDLMRNEIDTLQARLARAKQEVEDQLVRAGSAGRFVVAGEVVLAGQFLEPDTVVAYIVPPRSRTVRLAFSQADIGSFNDSVLSVAMQFAEQTGERVSYSSSVTRVTPKAGNRVVTSALTTDGGGTLLADPTGDGRDVLEPVFDVELAWPANAPTVHVGSHVWVKFTHEPKSVAERIGTEFQRAFLGRLDA